MAVGIDKRIQKSLARHPNILWRRLSSPIREIIRKFLRSRCQGDLYELKSTGEVTLCLQNFKSDDIALFQERGWLFVEDFLPIDLYTNLASSWPETRWFQPLKYSQRSKTYDSAFKIYVRQSREVLVHHSLQTVYCYLTSKEFESQISALSMDGGSMQCYWLTTINSYWGSGLAPHRDTPDIDSSGRDRRINIIYFVDSNGEGWDAGGTAILSENNFSKPVFVPGQLRNSLLIYATGAPFYHGFPPIKFGKFRHVLTAHYKAFD